MKWFGESWGAPVCHPEEHVETPDGEVCPECIRSIRPGDQGFVLPYVNGAGSVGPLSYHRVCLERALGVTPRP